MFTFDLPSKPFGKSVDDDTERLEEGTQEIGVEAQNLVAVAVPNLKSQQIKI